MDKSEIQHRLVIIATALEGQSLSCYDFLQADAAPCFKGLVAGAEVIARELFRMAEEMDRSLTESRAAEQVNGGAVDAWFAENRGRLMQAWRADCS